MWLRAMQPVDASSERERSLGRSRVATLPARSSTVETLPGDTIPASHPPEWCVDLGAKLQTMSTFELWVAIDRRELAPSVKVWREGMECWTPLDRVAELVCAIHTGRTPTPEPTTTDAAASAAPELAAPARDAHPPRWRAVIARLSGASRRAVREGGWVALGSLIAAGAITMAFAGDAATATPEVPPRAPAMDSRAPIAVEDRSAAPAPVARRGAPADGDRRLRPDERGQRRRRGGARTEHGR